MHYIYGLFDPRDGQLRYIGRTTNLYARYKSHRQGILTGAERDSWAWDLRNNGLVPELKELDQATDNTVDEVEQFYIGYFRMLGANLTNGISYNRYKKSKRKGKEPIIVRMDPDILEKVDQRAAEEGISRSAWIVQSCALRLKDSP